MRYIVLIITALVISVSPLGAQRGGLHTLYSCIDSSAMAANSMRTEINAAKQCAELFAPGYDEYVREGRVPHVVDCIGQGRASTAFHMALEDTSLTRFQRYRLLAWVSVLKIDMQKAEDYYDKTLQYDEGNAFANILEFSEFCRIAGLRHKAKDLGLRALSTASSPYEEYLSKLNMVRVYLELQEGEKALRELSSIPAIRLRHKPKDMEPLLNMLRGEIFLQKDEPKVALLYFQDAIKGYRKIKDKYKEPQYVLCEMSTIEIANGNYDVASQCLTDALKYCDRYPNEIDRNISKSSVYLQWGMLLKNLGMLGPAREKLQTSLQCIGQIVMRNRNYIADLAEIESAQAALEIEMNDFRRAEVLCEDAYGIYSQERFEKSVEAMAGKASLLRTYGDLYTSWGNYRMAKSKYDEALDTYMMLSRTNNRTFDANRAMVLNNMGYMYEHFGFNSEAIMNYKMASRILGHILETHPRYLVDYGKTLSNVGNLYRKFGLADSSLKYLEMSLNVFRSKPELNDNDKVEYSKLCNNLGLQYRQMGNFDIAEPFFESAYQIRKYLIGKSDAYLPLWADILNNYGLYYVDVQDYDLGIYYLEKALEIRQGLSQDIEASRLLAESYDNLGDVYSLIDSLEMSEQYYQKSLEVRGKLINYAHSEYPGYVGTVQKLAAVYRRDNALYHALMLMTRLIIVLEEADTWDGEDLDWKSLAEADAYHNQALILSDLGKKKEARDAMLHAARGYHTTAEYVDFKYYPIAADAFCQVGNLSCDIDDYEQAEMWYKSALSISKKLYNSGEVPAYTMVNALNNLGRMYYSMSNMEEAKKCYVEGKELLDSDRGNEADIETILTSAIINLNIVEYYIYEKNSGIDDDEYSNCIKYLEETITILKPFLDNGSVAQYYEQAQLLLNNILN